ncbi:histidine phosphatase superfamily [Nemania abortiva]|nr:histidine phosphatase superfamily [Nemania abortiva]
MPVTIDIVRHAESRHNVEHNGDALRDPSLTEAGTRQAVALGATFPYTTQVRRLISSPMRRAIQTGLLAFGSVVEEKHLEVVLVPELQEASARPSDTGSPPLELREEFANVLNLDFLSHDWWHKDASSSYGSRDQGKVAEKARQARLYIRSVARTLNDGDHIVVVAHSGFIKHLIQGAPKFGNAEFRSCKFVDLLGHDEQALLVEAKDDQEVLAKQLGVFKIK